MNYEFYYLLDPAERKKARHADDMINRPERHNPTAAMLQPQTDICYQCVGYWKHKYAFDAREHCYKRIDDTKGPLSDESISMD